LKEDIKKCFPNADLLKNFADRFSTISNLDYTVERKMDDVKRELNARMNDLNNKINELGDKINTQQKGSLNDLKEQIFTFMKQQNFGGQAVGGEVQSKTSKLSSSRI